MVKSFRAPDKYFQGPGILTEIADYIRFLGERFLVVTDPIVKNLLETRLHQGMKDLQYTIECFDGESTAAESARIAQLARGLDAAAIIGIGGGKVLDVSKAAANQNGMPVVIVPSSAASDAPCTALSVVYDENGKFVVSNRMKRNPDVVLVDSQVIAEAPVRHLLSGMGDAFATYYEARACKQSGVDTMFVGKRNEAAYRLAELCLELLLRYGAQAKVSVQQRQWSEALEKVCEANIFLSGVGAENNGAAMAHAIYSGMTQVYDPFPVMHGEAVAYGVLVQLAMEYANAGGVNRKEWDQTLDFYRTVGLPMHLAQLNLSDDEVQIRALAAATCVLPNAKKLPFPVCAASIETAVYWVEKHAE